MKTLTTVITLEKFLDECRSANGWGNGKVIPDNMDDIVSELNEKGIIILHDRKNPNPYYLEWVPSKYNPSEKIYLDWWVFGDPIKEGA